MKDNHVVNRHLYRSVRVLLVDDEVAYLNALSKRLRKRGFETSVAHSGAEGIQALRQAEFDVAVLDLKMEDLDGIFLLKTFKRISPTMAVIMLTGHGSEQAAHEGMECGAFDYLIKPCELEELVEKIKLAVEDARRRLP